MGTKNNPGDFDCYENAEQGEPMFVLLARDRLAPNLVLQWANDYEMTCGLEPTEKQTKKLIEARRCASDMEFWRNERK